ncbi:hypothetical protein M2404_002813 [Rheinheimera pacifica]|uniref:hypothetical protein n=1 Tax=Rheinheimera pacifica TaxID=173990 RepID=UPI002169518A|nr:hypothetical protein [Rheinheimera pacifica]MCS4308456.1 hypothetical protein [Rheinheimera pacifica]
MNKVMNVLIFLIIQGCAAAPKNHFRHEYQTYSVDGYLMRIFKDGSGSFGRQEELVAMGNHWSFSTKKDEMTDKIILTAYRRGFDQDAYLPMNSKIGIYIDLSSDSSEIICVYGHDFPGQSAMVRVGKNTAINTNEYGCTELTADLSKQLESEKSVKVRGKIWPDNGYITTEVNLDGYSKVVEFLRLRKNVLMEKSDI